MSPQNQLAWEIWSMTNMLPSAAGYILQSYESVIKEIDSIGAMLQRLATIRRTISEHEPQQRAGMNDGKSSRVPRRHR